jgi:hypothetical protein
MKSTSPAETSTHAVFPVSKLRPPKRKFPAS